MEFEYKVELEYYLSTGLLDTKSSRLLFKSPIDADNYTNYTRCVRRGTKKRVSYIYIDDHRLIFVNNIESCVFN